MELLTSEQIADRERDYNRLQMIKILVPRYDEYLKQGLINLKQYDEEMKIFVGEIEHMEKKYGLTPLDELMDSPLDKLDKIWLQVKKEGKSWN